MSEAWASRQCREIAAKQCNNLEACAPLLAELDDISEAPAPPDAQGGREKERKKEREREREREREIESESGSCVCAGAENSRQTIRC